MNLFKMNYGQAVDKLDYFIEHKYLERDENYVYRLTSKGLDVLKESGLDNIDIIEILDDASDENVYRQSKSTEQNIVFIPKEFDKKFNGY